MVVKKNKSISFLNISRGFWMSFSQNQHARDSPSFCFMHCKATFKKKKSEILTPVVKRVNNLSSSWILHFLMLLNIQQQTHASFFLLLDYLMSHCQNALNIPNSWYSNVLKYHKMDLLLFRVACPCISLWSKSRISPM